MITNMARNQRAALAGSSIRELTNTGTWIENGGERLRLSGVDDLWNGTQDLDAALADATDSDACVVLCHNPDYVESLRDPRVSLVLSGHTHGGQAVFPVIGAPIVPSAYGQKYVRGLVQAPATQVYVTRGLGTITPPLRFCCRPEISLLTLVETPPPPTRSTMNRSKRTGRPLGSVHVTRPRGKSGLHRTAVVGNAHRPQGPGKCNRK